MHNEKKQRAQVVYAGRRKTSYSHPAMSRVFALKESLVLPAVLHSRFLYPFDLALHLGNAGVSDVVGDNSQ